MRKIFAIVVLALAMHWGFLSVSAADEETNDAVDAFEKHQQERRQRSEQFRDDVKGRHVEHFNAARSSHDVRHREAMKRSGDDVEAAVRDFERTRGFGAVIKDAAKQVGGELTKGLVPRQSKAKSGGESKAQSGEESESTGDGE